MKQEARCWVSGHFWNAVEKHGHCFFTVCAVTRSHSLCLRTCSLSSHVRVLFARACQSLNQVGKTTRSHGPRFAAYVSDFELVSLITFALPRLYSFKSACTRDSLSFLQSSILIAHCPDPKSTSSVHVQENLLRLSLVNHCRVHACILLSLTFHIKQLKLAGLFSSSNKFRSCFSVKKRRDNTINWYIYLFIYIYFAGPQFSNFQFPSFYVIRVSCITTRSRAMARRRDGFH